MHISLKNQDNDFLLNLFEKNYFNSSITPLQQYKRILECDYWFTLYDDKHNIIASCSVSQENDFIFEINDVLVEEEYRGNGFVLMLLMNVLYYFDKNFDKKVMIKITSELDNIPAIKAYNKIFGKPYRQDTRYAYFSI